MQYIHNSSLAACRKLGVVSTVQVGIDVLFHLGKPFASSVHKPLCETGITNFCTLYLYHSILNMNSGYKDNKIGLLSEGVFEQFTFPRPKTFFMASFCLALSHQIVPPN